MILTGQEIFKQIEQQTIHISPFTFEHLGSNSYDVTLSSNLLCYDFAQKPHLDMKQNNPTTQLTIPKEGLVLQPNTLYLGCTQETATSHQFVPMFEGRSSIGRLGMHTHITAGFGDIGWGYDDQLNCTYPTWTLEIEVVHPIRVYSEVRIGQIYFLKPQGDLKMYQGKYTNQKKPYSSHLFKDFLA